MISLSSRRLPSAPAWVWNNIVLGNGSNDVLDLVARVFLAPGRSAIFAQYAFAVYPLATLAAGAEPIAVAARDFGHDLDAMRAAIRPDTRLIWIANPNNPTGTFLPYPQLRRFCSRCRRMSWSCSTKPITSTCRPPSGSRRRPGWRNAESGDHPHLFQDLRPGRPAHRLRAGSAEIADLMNRVRQPFNCNNLALAAAVAALDDHQFVAASYALNRAGMEQIVAGLKRLAARTFLRTATS
jgi:histidinol-phosphate aminotransferase